MRALHYSKRSFLLVLFFCFQTSLAEAQYCAVSFPSGVEPVTLVDFAGINNATSNAIPGGTDLEDFTSMTGYVVQGQTYAITVKSNTDGPYSNYIRVYIDWNQNNDFTDPGESFDVGTVYNSTGIDAVQATANILIPFGSTPGTTRMRVLAKYNAYATSCNTTGWGQAEDYTLNVLAGNSCTGTPVAGTASAPASVCPGTPFSLSLAGYTSASGIDIQWEYDAGGGWQSFPGAITASYAVTTGITNNTSYRAILTCVNGGGSDVFNTISVAVNPPTQCYCSISYPLSGGGPISLVDFAGINNSTSAATGATPSYQDFTSITGTVMQSASYTMSVKGNTVGNYSDYVRVFIDWNQNGSFSDPDESFDIGVLTNTTGTDAIVVTSPIAVPATALTGLTRMRVTKMWNGYSTPCNAGGYGQAEDYTLDVLASNSCLGTPISGTAAAPASVCANVPFNLSLAGYTVASGIDIQWEYNDGGGWLALAGANTSVYAVPGIAVPTQYRAIVTCSNGGLQDISNVAPVAISPFYNCYCAASNAGGTPITNVTISGTSLNNSSGAAPAPDYYIAYPASGSATADLVQGVTYSLSATFGSSAIASLWIDFNQDGVFDASEWTQIATSGVSANASFSVPPGALTGTTGMRVRSRGTGLPNGSTDACTTLGSGETEDYMVTIVPGVSCSGTPTAGTVTAPANICSGASFNLDLTGYTQAIGISIQWEYNDGAGWQPLPGATNATYSVSAGITIPTSYHAIVSCSVGSGQSGSNDVAVAINPANQCYCAISYPSGVESITLVDFAGITNATANSSGTEDEDFTSMTGVIAKGQTLPIAIKGNTGGNYTDYIRVFIDWDQDGTFNGVDESFDLGTIVNSTGTDAVQASGNILAPASAVYGNTRMRVTKKWNGYSTACNSTGYGQAEEYSLTVTFPLSLILRNIRVHSVNGRNRIDWTTLTEAAGDWFELERSADGKSFTTLSMVAAAGRPSDYTHWDNYPPAGVSFYRLKMIDASGKISYSGIVSAGTNSASMFAMTAGPNPVKNQLHISFTEALGSGAQVSLIDPTGKVLRVVPVSGQAIILPVNDLPSGIYWIRLTDELHNQTVRFMKQ